MNENEIKELIRRNIVADASVCGLFCFLQKSDLEDEAKKFLKDFLGSLTENDWQELAKNMVKSIKEVKNDTRESAEERREGKN